MEYDKMYGPENGNVVIAIGRYYLSKDGERHATAAAAGEGYTAKAEAGIRLSCNPAEWAEDVRAAAMIHSFTRKAQEHFQAVKRAEGDFGQAAVDFPEAYAKLIKGEKEKAEAGVKVVGPEARAVAYVADVLRQKHAAGKLADAKVPVPRLDDPPVTAKGAINFNAWAKVLKEAEHPWYSQALKKVSETEKGFD